ncbi:DUF4136 domain-containing protein [Pontiella sp.]|uniref:DUF4136 domain-containing protein n=1 Tax=Pontiella sp. TaxID=2837462 RepID=UPI0035643B84
MNRTLFLSLAGAGLLLSGCSSVLVERDYDAAFNFQTLETYAWKHAVQPETGVPRIDNDLNDRRIRQAVDDTLRAKGFTLAENPAAADFHVEYFMEFRQRIESSGGSVSLGIGSYSGGRAGSLGWSTGANVSDYEEAQLTIDILEPNADRTIWRGRGLRRASSSADPAKLTSRTQEVVSRILKKFPPQ